MADSSVNLEHLNKQAIERDLRLADQWLKMLQDFQTFPELPQEFIEWMREGTAFFYNNLAYHFNMREMTIDIFGLLFTKSNMKKHRKNTGFNIALFRDDKTTEITLQQFLLTQLLLVCKNRLRESTEKQST